ncbi:MAG: metal-dependent hydrolase [Thermoanaerobaculia bacterium]
MERASFPLVDTVTHGLAGALLGRAFAKESAGPVTAVCTFAAMFPDCDAFFLPGSWFSLHDTLGYLQYHRGVTHSFVLAPLFAAGIAGIAKIFARRAKALSLGLAALFGIVSHILFDWITSYGTTFFAPLSWRRYALDWTFILDPVFSGILVAALIAAALLRSRSRRVSAIGSLLLFGYIAFCGLVHRRAMAAARNLFPGARVAALPQPFSPFRWALFADREQEIDVAYVRLDGAPRGPSTRLPAVPGEGFAGILETLRESYLPPGSAAVQRFARNGLAPAFLAARTFPDVAAWLRFARFPVAAVESAGARGTRLVLTDLRFQGPWRRPAFQFEVVVSADGREVASGFVRRFTSDRAAAPR